MRAIRGDQRAAVADAEILVSGADSTHAVTDTTGTFDITIRHPGRHELLVRRIGYALRHDTVTTSIDAGQTLIIPLQPVTTDGPCSGFSVFVIRKPWWKVW